MQSSVVQLSKEAAIALNQRDYRRAAELCRRLLQQDPRCADGWFLMGMVAAANQRTAKALELVDNAVALETANPDYLSQKARLHTLLGQPEAAREAADGAVAAQPTDPLTLDTLGVVYTRTGHYALAKPLLEQAVATAPDNAQFHFNLASVEQFLGDFGAAAREYERSIQLNPRFFRAYWAHSELRKAEPAPQLVATLEALLAEPQLSVDDELYLAHALAAEYEKDGRYDDAFRILAGAKARRRARIRYDISQDEALFGAIRKAFPLSSAPVAPAARDEEAGSDAIFVIGMPRTGTTLVERILDSHPEVRSLGEIQDFAMAVKNASGSTSRAVLDQDVMMGASAAPAASIGQRYLDAISARLQQDGRFVDKMPLNFLYVGFILQALPGARIVCLQRHPLDTCISNYRQLFALDFSYYNYHYDLEDTARYYALFTQLMAHWQAYGNGRVHEVSYEALTADPESEVGALLEHLNLAWDPACLAFHENPSAVATASTAQVRQPIYRSSVSRWKRYESHLQGAKTVLEQHGIDWRD
jgi:tetratricopeptide (TPR) repeat protein